MILRDVKMNLYLLCSEPTYGAQLGKSLAEQMPLRTHRHTSGEEFLAYLHHHVLSKREVHVAIVSFQLSGSYENALNGLELLEIIRREWPHLFVIMLASETDREYTGEALQRGALGVVERDNGTEVRVGSLLLRCLSTQRIEIRRRAFIISIAILALSIALFAIILQLFFSFPETY